MPFLLRLFAVLSAVLALLPAVPAWADDEFLDPNVAFQMSARMADAKTVEVTWKIADGYYMYRERFAFRADGASLGAAQIPPGKVKYDETFAKEVETYHGSVTIRVPVETAGPFTLTATGQGCSEKGLCYSPQDATVRLGGAAGDVGVAAAAPAAAPFSLQMSPAQTSAPAASMATARPPDVPVPAQQSELGRIDSALQGGRLAVIVPLFLLLGLGLSFTPCVLPMVPILSSIIVGEGSRATRKRGVVLSGSYALGMAIVYTALGVAAGLVGEGLAAALQNPWVLGAFGLLMAALALSMFGLYELQVPSALQSRLAAASGRQSTGKLAGVFAMGAISALIVGPCVAAPLAGALVYISQTRNVLIGGSALFAMAVGMSVPLMLVGISAGSLLPRAGAWMDAVKRFFGVLLLAMAWWLVSPVLPPVVQMSGWAVLGIGYGTYLIRQKNGWLAKVIAALAILFGIVQMIGVATGSRDPLAPLSHIRGTAESSLVFKRIASIDELDNVLANTGGKTVMLDFYADWCVACKEMEKLTFVDPAVKVKLANTILIQADVTANSAADKALLKRFNLFGPPGIIFFNRNGQEIPDSRVIGFQDAREFTASLQKLN
ncbi:protein-disulfide reductase DsbD [Pseudoduganella chitinolytica]|uniref:Thiol:disulfide interchange protein DsbD n=1 Tax=Pseudoduganella chitinolytica TaxID=34070 RepID=A0ABY8B9N1_9BURK|nr:protein-disulfide reductase DsbD [Pseudoduganella chitinolytica]WEF32515.1 protein-disulfide reductase DsbD [Pseudoduganella chitinolytica]